MGAEDRDKRLRAAVVGWVEKEQAHNPSFSLVIGQRAFDLDQIKEHIVKKTETGEKLLDMVVDAGASLFLNAK